METSAAQNYTSAREKPDGTLLEIIESSASEKSEPVLLTNLPDEANRIIAEAIHDLSLWSNRSFFVLTCQAKSDRQAKIQITYPILREVPDFFTGGGIPDHLKGGTVLLTDPHLLPIHQQETILSFLTDLLLLKVIITTRSAAREQREQLPVLRNVRVIKVPALRNQSEDIRFAANYFLSRANLEWNKNIPGISENCLQQLTIYPWPGQLPQLMETIRQAAFLSPPDQVLGPGSLPLHIRNFRATDRDFLKEAVKQAEYEMIHKTLRETNNNKRKAAEILKISRKTLYSKINMYKITSYPDASS